MADGGISAAMDFNLIKQFYMKGHYERALDKLQESSSCVEDYYILENNKIVCQSLMNLVSLHSHEKEIGALLKLYDNFCVNNNHTGKYGHRHVGLTILFNCQWLALTTSYYYSSDNQILWDRLTSRVINSCHQVFAAEFTVGASQESWNLILKLFLETLAKLSSSDIKITSLFLETVLCTLLIHLRDCSKADVFDTLQFLKSVSKNAVELLARDSTDRSMVENIDLFKFSVCSSSGPLTYHNERRMERILQLFAQLGCILSVRLKESPSSCFKTVSHSPLWRFCQGLRYFKEQDLKSALGHLLEGLRTSLPTDLQCQYQCLLGRVYSKLGERQKALSSFSNSVLLNQNYCSALYYQGQEYGKMGMTDLMLHCYQNLVKATTTSKKGKKYLTLEDLLLEILPQDGQLSKATATYLLAVAYADNKRYEEARATFEKLLTFQNLSSAIASEEDGFLIVPRTIVILHEAAAMNLCVGNFCRAEELCRQAISIYPSQGRATTSQIIETHCIKDQNWIREVLQEEFQIEIGEPIDVEPYYEDYLSIFDEDIIGLLILAELQEKLSSEEAPLLLNQALLLLSKYIARTQKQGNKPELRKQETLVKALACKTCLHIAKMQTKLKPFPEVDKMFKRALSCNNGDKDVLYFYTNYLLESNKRSDAVKLWNTFYDKESILNAVNNQSLALRHILRPLVSQRSMTELSITINKRLN